MAALNVNTTVAFGARGLSDPCAFMPQIAISREADFAKANFAGGENYRFISVPKGFVATGAFVGEIEKCAAGKVFLRAASDSANITPEAGVAVGGTDLAHAANGLAAPKAFGAEEMLCLSSSVAQTSGRVRVTVIGYCPDAESFACAQNVDAWRENTQTLDNVSGGNID